MIYTLDRLILLRNLRSQNAMARRRAGLLLLAGRFFYFQPNEKLQLSAGLKLENCLKVTYVTLYICSPLLLVSPRALAMLVNLSAKFSKLRNCMAGGYPKDKGWCPCEGPSAACCKWDRGHPQHVRGLSSFFMLAFDVMISLGFSMHIEAFICECFLFHVRE